ncbi:MAG: TIGR03987 family protein [Anaerolineae bacterium]|nr:TIGR03987 family protein [Anaerolineae bacterium]
MSNLLMIAVSTVTLALIIYSVAIWGERLTHGLRGWQVVLMWLGLVLDTLSSILMASIAGEFRLDLHGITGLVANLVMLAAAIWSTLALRSERPDMRQVFHRYAIWLWVIWLISYFTGAMLSMGR